MNRFVRHAKLHVPPSKEKTKHLFRKIGKQNIKQNELIDEDSEKKKMNGNDLTVIANKNFFLKINKP